MESDKLGCDYTGNEFGAWYEDAACIDGYLWDMDSCDEPGGPLSVGGDIACPECNHAEWLADWCVEMESDGACDADDESPREFKVIKGNLKYPDDFDALKAAWLKGYDQAS